MGEPATESRKAVVWLLTVVAIFVPATLVYLGFWAGFSLYYDPEKQGHAKPYYLAALVIGVLAPIVGIGLSVRSGQVVPRVLLGLVLVITLFVSAVSTRDSVRNDAPEPDTRDHPTTHYCQEYSGGDATCPGG
jgi:hypothetical protein